MSYKTLDKKSMEELKKNILDEMELNEQEYLPSEIHSKMIKRGYDTYSIRGALFRLITRGNLLLDENLKIKSSR